MVFNQTSNEMDPFWGWGLAIRLKAEAGCSPSCQVAFWDHLF